jgi:hypothetical protein
MSIVSFHRVNDRGTLLYFKWRGDAEIVLQESLENPLGEPGHPPWPSSPADPAAQRRGFKGRKCYASLSNSASVRLDDPDTGCLSVRRDGNDTRTGPG